MATLSISMPLLALELARQSEDIKIYRLRFAVGAALAFPAAITILLQWITGAVSTSFGTDLATTQFFLLQMGIYAILPAMTANAIAVEKENGSLPILLLTDMSAADVVLQKFLSRLMPMATLLLLSSPVFAVAYAYGGTNLNQIAGMTLTLFVECVQVAAFAILCSAICRNTTSAVIATYVFGALVYFGPYLLAELDHNVWFLGGVTDGLFNTATRRAILLSWVPFYAVAGDAGSPWKVLVALIPALFTSSVFLHAAGRAVVRSLTVTSHPLGVRFRKWDAILDRLNRRLGGIGFGRDVRSVPGDVPVTWRETNRLGLARRDHRIRLILLVEVPVLFLVAILSPGGASPAAWAVLATITWIVCGFALLIQATLAIPSERTDQTLDILLVTPMRSTEIVEQKFAALNRLFLLLMIPSCTVFLPLVLTCSRNPWNDERVLWSLAFVTVIAAMRSLMFLGLYCGARFPDKLRALTKATALGIGLAFAWIGCIVAAVSVSAFVLIYGLPLMLLFLRMTRDRYLQRAAGFLRPRQMFLRDDVGLE